jgi:hypothetical protein
VTRIASYGARPQRYRTSTPSTYTCNDAYMKLPELYEMVQQPPAALDSGTAGVAAGATFGAGAAAGASATGAGALEAAGAGSSCFASSTATLLTSKAGTGESPPISTGATSCAPL